MNPRRLIALLYIALLAGLGVAAAALFFDARGEYARLRLAEATSRQHLASTEARLKEQERILERLRTDPAFIEKVIRRRLGYAKPDEFIFRFED